MQDCPNLISSVELIMIRNRIALIVLDISFQLFIFSYKIFNSLVQVTNFLLRIIKLLLQIDIIVLLLLKFHTHLFKLCIKFLDLFFFFFRIVHYLWLLLNLLLLFLRLELLVSLRLSMVLTKLIKKGGLSCLRLVLWAEALIWSHLFSQRLKIITSPIIIELAGRLVALAGWEQICLEVASTTRDLEVDVFYCLSSEANSSCYFAAHGINKALWHEVDSFLGVLSFVGVEIVYDVWAFLVVLEV